LGLERLLDQGVEGAAEPLTINFSRRGSELTQF